jgi:hypothetical protein
LSISTQHRERSTFLMTRQGCIMSWRMLGKWHSSLLFLLGFLCFWEKFYILHKARMGK